MKELDNNRIASTILLLLVSLKIGGAVIVTKPSDTEVVVGGSTYFNCSTNVLSQEIHWFHTAFGSNKNRNIVYGYEQLFSSYSSRFKIEKNEAQGAFNLVIQSVKVEDAGAYECQDDAGRGHKGRAQLIILDTEPVCEPRLETFEIIGLNNCGIEPQQLILSCIVKYYGNEAPIMEWRQVGDNKSISEGVTNKTIDNNRVVYNLTVNGNSTLQEEVSYFCNITRSASTGVGCESGTLKVKGSVAYCPPCDAAKSCKPYRDAIICITCLVLPTVIVVQRRLCTKRASKRKENAKMGKKAADQKNTREEFVLLESKQDETRTDEVEKAKAGKLQKEKKLGPEIERLQKDKRRLEEEKHQLQLKLREMEQHLYPSENIDYLDKSNLLHTIQVGSSKKDKKVICGIAILYPNLFIVFENCQEIEVYDSVTYKFQTKRIIDKMKFPLDITSSKANNCFYVYIMDRVNDESKSQILKIDPKGELLNNWPTDGGPGRLSSSESNVIACLLEKNQICEYSGDGQLLRTVSFSPADGFVHPLHAIKVTSMHFMVSYGDVKDKSHRVCVVDLNGKVVKEFAAIPKSSFGFKSTEKMNVPICLAENSDRFVIVADRDNKQILLLNSVLKFERKPISEDNGLRGYPVRLAFGDEGNLFIAENCYGKEWHGGLISVFVTKNLEQRGKVEQAKYVGTPNKKSGE